MKEARILGDACGVINAVQVELHVPERQGSIDASVTAKIAHFVKMPYGHAETR